MTVALIIYLIVLAVIIAFTVVALVALRRANREYQAELRRYKETLRRYGALKP